jgi:hypothetical protein
MADNDSTGKARPVKKLKQQQLTECHNCALLDRAMDTITLAQSGFNDLSVLCQVTRSTCDQHTNPYHLAGIGLYLADDWINTLDGELEVLKAIRQHQS